MITNFTNVISAYLFSCATLMLTTTLLLASVMLFWMFYCDYADLHTYRTSYQRFRRCPPVSGSCRKGPEKVVCWTLFLKHLVNQL